MFNILLASILIMLASLIGIIFIWKKLGQILEKNLRFLVSFSAGVFLIIAYEISKETLEHATSFSLGLMFILIGAIAFYLIFKLLPSFHHHHGGQTDQHKHSTLDVRKIILGDGIHNIGDGLLLVTSFLVSTSLGLLTALSIFIHELIQEISEFFVLREAGFSIKKALTVNFITSSTILIGSIGGFFLLEKFEKLHPLLLGLTAGAFLIVVIEDLIPHSLKTSHQKTDLLRHLFWFLLGIAIMAGLNLVTGH